MSESAQGAQSVGKPVSAAANPLIILSCGRSGSTLIQRILNTCEKWSISGENYGAIEDLLLFYHKLLTSKQYVPQDNSGFLTYEKCVANNIKPCWYNTYHLEAVKVMLQLLIVNMFNPNGKFRVWGFKEIRFGIQEACSGDLFEDRPVFTRNREGMETIIGLMRSLFPNLKVIVNTRNVNDISKSAWFKDHESKTRIQAQQDLLVSYATQHSDFCYVIDYSQVCKNDDELRDLFVWLHEPYNQSAVAVVLKCNL